MEPLTLSVEDAKRVIGIGTTKIYELIAENRLAVVKIGRKTLITTDSIRELVKRATV